jgi:hypothetical protein
MNLKTVEKLIEDKKEFKYSTMFGDLSCLDIESERVFFFPVGQAPLQVIIKYVLNYWSEDEVFFAGMYGSGLYDDDDDIYYIHVRTTGHFIQRMTPSEWLKGRLGKDTTQGKPIHLMMENYANYCIDVHERQKKYKD